MSRKSRQRGARKLLQKALPLWLALPMFLLALGFGVFCVTMPFVAQPPDVADAAVVSATLEQVEPTYHAHRKRQELHSIKLHFTDHDAMWISAAIASDALLDKLEDCPPGTVLEMQVVQDDVLAITVGDEALLTFKASMRALSVNNYLGFGLGVFFLALAGFCGWSLVIGWRYRRLAST